MKRLLIYPVIVPVMAMLSAICAMWPRQAVVLETHSLLDQVMFWSFTMSFGVPFVLPAMLLDLWRNKRHDIALEDVAQQSVFQRFWITLYAALIANVHWLLSGQLERLTTLPFYDYLFPLEDFSYFAYSVACLWAIERVTGRKPSPSPAFLWRRWKRSWTLTTEK